MNFITCHVCQTQNPADNQVCQSCQTPLQKTDIVCSECYHSNAPTASFCGNCGSLLASASGADNQETQSAEAANKPGTGPLTSAPSIPDWLDGVDSFDDSAGGDVGEPAKAKADTNDIDWLEVLDFGEPVTEMTTRDTEAPETTDWVAKLSRPEDDKNNENRPLSFTEKLLMSETMPQRPADLEDVLFGEEDVVDFGELVGDSNREEGDDDPSLLAFSGDTGQLDALLVMDDLDDLDEEVTEINDMSESSGFTDWLTSVEEESAGGFADTAAQEAAAPVLDELPDWLVPDSAEDAEIDQLSVLSDTLETDDTYEVSPQNDDDQAADSPKPQTQEMGVTAWLENLTMQSAVDLPDDKPEWINDSHAENQALLQKFPTWLLENPEESGENSQLPDVNSAASGFTDWIVSTDDVLPKNTTEKQGDDFAWLSDPNQADSFGSADMANWLAGDVATTPDQDNEPTQDVNPEPLFDDAAFDEVGGEEFGWLTGAGAASDFESESEPAEMGQEPMLDGVDGTIEILDSVTTEPETPSLAIIAGETTEVASTIDDEDALLEALLEDDSGDALLRDLLSDEDDDETGFTLFDTAFLSTGKLVPPPRVSNVSDATEFTNDDDLSAASDLVASDIENIFAENDEIDWLDDSDGELSDDNTAVDENGWLLDVEDATAESTTLDDGIEWLDVADTADDDVPHEDATDLTLSSLLTDEGDDNLEWLSVADDELPSDEAENNIEDVMSIGDDFERLDDATSAVELVTDSEPEPSLALADDLDPFDAESELLTSEDDVASSDLDWLSFDRDLTDAESTDSLEDDFFVTSESLVDESPVLEETLPHDPSSDLFATEETGFTDILNNWDDAEDGTTADVDADSFLLDNAIHDVDPLQASPPTGFTDLLGASHAAPDDDSFTVPLDLSTDDSPSVSFDDWFGDEDDDLTLDTADGDVLAFLSDDAPAPQSNRTGFTGWLTAPDHEDEEPLEVNPATDTFSDTEAEDPPAPKKRTGFTGWLTSEEDEMEEDEAEEIDMGLVSHIPDWLRDSDELPTLENQELEQKEDDNNNVVLGEDTGPGQSFSDWLKQSGVEIEEESEDLMTESEPTGFTQWLTDPDQEPIDLSELEDGTDDDWLANIIPVKDDTSEEVMTDMPDWLTDTPTESEAMEVSENEELPDWLRAPGTGDLDPSVVDEIDELLETGDAEWLAELESGPLDYDKVATTLENQLESEELDTTADVLDLDDENWLGTAESSEDDMMAELLGNSTTDDSDDDDASWLASLNLDDADEEDDAWLLETDPDAVFSESTEDIIMNTDLPDWLLAARPDDDRANATPTDDQFAMLGDSFDSAPSEESGVDDQFLAKLSLLDDDASDDELDLSDVDVSWDSTSDELGVDEDDLPEGDVPDWLQPSDDGLAKANIPDWLQQKRDEEADDENLFVEPTMATADTGITTATLEELGKVVPIAAAINLFIPETVEFTTETGEQDLETISERQNKKAESWSKIVQHDVAETLTRARRAPKLKVKNQVKEVQPADFVDKENEELTNVEERKRSPYRSLMILLLIVLLLYFVWLFEPAIFAQLRALFLSLISLIDLSAIQALLP